MKGLLSTPLRAARTYGAPGVAIPAIAERDVQSNRPVVVDNMVGWATKIDLPGRFTDPSSAAYTLIEAGEEFTLHIGGAHELRLEAPFAAAGVGARLWIDPDDDSVDDAAATGDLPLGVIQAVDATRNPDVARVNTNAWQAFLPSA